MGLFSKDRIAFKQSFTEKYKLEVTSNIKTGNMLIDSKVEIRWEVKVKSISENRINFELLTLDNQLIEYNNPLVKTMFDMNQVFSKIYSELDLIVNGNYKLIEIKNADLLDIKWRRIKLDLQDMIAEEPKIIGEIINLNDKNFESPDLLKSIVQNNEFFLIYFHHLYGNKVPAITKRITKKNIFNTAFVDWEYRNSKQKEVSGEYADYEIEGFVETNLNLEWVKKYYASFSHLDLEKIEPVMTEEGLYRIDSDTGGIRHAILTRKEIAHPQLLHGTTKYELKSESSPAKKEKNDSRKLTVEPPNGYDPKRPSFLIESPHSFVIDE